jgi:drug/metabolite transporter (DMT)-like permease
MSAPSSRVKLLAAFAAVYVIWGSTYLAIKFAIATLPPLLMGGTRFLAAGAILYIWSRARGVARPTRLHWRSALIIGALLLVGGNGGVVLGEQAVPSSLTALLISTTPIWMTLLDWLRPGGTKPSGGVIFGLLIGFAGVALLIGPDLSTPGTSLNPLALAVILAASVSWAAGSLYSRGAPVPQSPLLGTGMEMLAGGALLLVAGLVTGEAGHLHVQSVSLGSALALGYLIVFGSLVAFTCYIFLLKATTTARVSTYAYVNPVVAVLLGWVFAGEQLKPITLLGAAVIVSAVVIITAFRSRAQMRPQPLPPPPPTEEPRRDLAPKVGARG